MNMNELITCVSCCTSTAGSSSNLVDSTFITGCNNFQKFYLNCQAASESHIVAMEIWRGQTQKQTDSQAFGSMKALERTTYENLNKLFRTEHALVKHDQPFRDIIWQSNLDETKGVDIGQTYRNDKECQVRN